MLVWTGVAEDARVKREAATLAEAGHTVHIIGREVPPDFSPPEGVSVSSAGMSSPFRRPAAGGRGRTLPLPLRLARWLLLPEHVRSSLRSWTAAARRDAEPREFDAVHAHDFTTLELGAALAASRGVPFVYDTHEYWYGRPRVGRPTPVRRRRERHVERRVGARAAAVITVSPGIADLLGGWHGWPDVQVVRNSFPLAAGGSGEGAGGAPDSPAGAVYAGRIAPYRELETVAAAAAALAPFPVTLMGPADETYLASFDAGPALVVSAGTDGEVEARLRHAGLALVTHSDRWVNHRLALPNKLFHAVQTGVPVVATDVPELARVVREHGIGTLYRPGDPGSLVAAVRAAQDRYTELVANVRAAAPALAWERDAEVLLGVYAKLAASVG